MVDTVVYAGLGSGICASMSLMNPDLMSHRICMTCSSALVSSFIFVGLSGLTPLRLTGASHPWLIVASPLQFVGCLAPSGCWFVGGFASSGLSGLTPLRFVVASPLQLLVRRGLSPPLVVSLSVLRRSGIHCLVTGLPVFCISGCRYLIACLPVFGLSGCWYLGAGFRHFNSSGWLDQQAAIPKRSIQI